MVDLPELHAAARRAEAALRNTALRFVMSNAMVPAVRNTRHFREWFRTPMNYARIMELPLTLQLLEARTSDRILDVSSPKLLALHYALTGHHDLVAADLEDYFVADFEAYRQHAKVEVQTATFNAARRIPYPDNSFDRIFSVSVVEHIPDDGDGLAIREMLRVLKPGGRLVVTVPVFPHYVEEWTVAPGYWRSVQDEQGKTFFQRRYDRHAVEARLLSTQGILEQTVLVAERPIEAPRIGPNGRMLHNSYYIDRVRPARWLRGVGRRLKVVPFTTYLAERIVARRCQYLSSDWNDPDIRQVVLVFGKAGAADPKPPLVEVGDTLNA